MCVHKFNRNIKQIFCIPITLTEYLQIFFGLCNFLFLQKFVYLQPFFLNVYFFNVYQNNLLHFELLFLNYFLNSMIINLKQVSVEMKYLETFIFVH